jgi:hypothetical protein
LRLFASISSSLNLFFRISATNKEWQQKSSKAQSKSEIDFVIAVPVVATLLCAFVVDMAFVLLCR